MSRFWSDIVHRLSPYVPGEQPQMERLVKLNTNENPYPPSPLAVAAMRHDLAEQSDALRLYPEPTGRVVREAVSRRLGVPASQVFVGNGSDEVLAHVFAGLLKHTDDQGRARPLLFPDVTYAFYPAYCALYGIEYRALSLDAGFGVRIDDYLQHADAGAIILPNPNAPTGLALPRAEIERLLVARLDTLVVIDEAYVDFGAESAVGLVARHPNLLVVQTLSKSRSLAGLRVGYAIGQEPLVEGLVRVKDSFNSYPLDRLALVGAAAALDDVAHFEATRLAVMRTRDQLAVDLRALGFEVLPSQANFVFARHPSHPGPQLAAALRAEGILVRRFDQPARIADFLRISIGTDAQCALLVDALRAWLASNP
jgi:histidinol-phosphate aminotransferase